MDGGGGGGGLTVGGGVQIFLIIFQILFDRFVSGGYPVGEGG